MAEGVVRFLELRGWYLKDTTIIRELVQRYAAEDLGRSELENLIEMNLLDMDLNTIGSKCLPDATSIQRLSRLQGPKVLQVVSVRNILQSSTRALVSSQQQRDRLLRICLTDGHSKVIAIEYHLIPSISEEIAPGTKVRLENIASVQSGILLLEPHSFCMLGGCVQSLYEEWEIDHKYSGFSRWTLKLPQAQISSGPPPFERLHIENNSTQTIREAQLQVNKFRLSHDANLQPAKKLTLISTNENPKADILIQDADVEKTFRKSPNGRIAGMIDDIGSSKNGSTMPGRVGRGYELYQPKASQYRSSAENLNLQEGSVVETSICSSSKSKSVLTENCKQHEVIMTTMDEVKNDKLQYQLRKNDSLGEGHPDVANDRTMLVAEAAPVQNQAAAQKLLKKMSDTCRGGRQYRYGRSGKLEARPIGKGKREETAFLTLDEWEISKGKMKTTSSRTDDVSQDAELAQRLQTQLDLEAANISVKMARDDEAERLRMSMFNFGNISNSKENTGRRPRGRGKAKGRFN